ncbi:hypothetical protein NIES4074_23600 [Cylindrospermum sp. NIES-4074]|nr:hypothetical protein NIES4074_23600 [Cylindrospermum sp. NIES-4074]
MQSFILLHLCDRHSSHNSINLGVTFSGLYQLLSRQDEKIPVFQFWFQGGKNQVQRPRLSLLFPPITHYQLPIFHRNSGKWRYQDRA